MLSLTNKILKAEPYLPILSFVRYKRKKLAVVDPKLHEEIFFDEARSLDSRLLEFDRSNPEIDFKVDIGLPPVPVERELIRNRIQYIKDIRNNTEMRDKSINLTLNPDLDKIREEWEKTSASKHIKVIAEHYNIFNDLFKDAYFTPHVIMNIYYPQKDKARMVPVCRGNVVKPAEAFHQPQVQFKSEANELWTLTLVNPDGHFEDPEKEYIHWFVGNIPGGDISKGETIWDYLPPFPPRGIGFQRLIFVLYKQDQHIDYSKLKNKLPRLELSDRTFQTLEFYRERQDFMTPAGLSFFQSDWDKAARTIFHEILNMEEPVFEYDHLPRVLNKQEWFPKKKPFDLYLDRYRDPRDVRQDYLLRKLKETNPFKEPEKPFPYPKAVSVNYYKMPSWLATKDKRYRLRRGQMAILAKDEYE